jgi:hypothetical protein
MAYDSGGSFDDIDDIGDVGDIDTGAGVDGADIPAAALTVGALAGGAAAAARAASSGANWSASDDGSGWFGSDDDGTRGGSRRRSPPRPPRPTRGGGWLAAIRRLFFVDTDEQPRIERLVAAARRARDLHPEVGHQCTAEVATAFGRHDLDGRSANEQVAICAAQWREVDARRAAALAGDGRLVVAGLAGEGGSGHTAVVLPGPGATHGGRFYPSVSGGGLPFRRSDGRRSAGEVWTAEERERVRYFTP